VGAKGKGFVLCQGHVPISKRLLWFYYTWGKRDLLDHLMAHKGCSIPK